MNDLNALVKNGAYLEFFEHAMDIRPSLRNEKWQKMSLKMAQKYMQEMNGKILNKEEIDKIISVLQYPHFNQDEFFLEKREKFLASLVENYSLSNSTRDTMLFANKIYKDFKKTKYFGLYITKKLYPIFKRKGVYQQNLKFFQQLLTSLTQSKFSEFYCHKTPLKEILTDSVLSNNVLPKLHLDCMKKLIPQIEKHLYAENSIMRKQSYKFLNKHKVLKSSDQAKYHILNLLNGKKVEKKNWTPVISSLEYFKNNYKVRMETLEILSEYDPYPDNFYLIYSNKQLKSLTRLLSKSFPEYLDRYTKNCLNYLSGKVSFPNGNPTPNCHRYMKISKESKSSPQQVLNQYDYIMNSWKTR